MPSFEPLLDTDGLDRLREALSGYTADALYNDLPPDAADGLGRGDLPRLRRNLDGDARLTTLVRLFVLGDPVPEAAAEQALAPLPVERAVASGLLVRSPGRVAGGYDLRPYSDERFGQPWWVLSDFGSDVRPGPVAADHVLGIGSASLTLIGATVPVHGGRALDLGTGSGVAALPLAASGAQVTATDTSARALRLAATAAALAGQAWDLRQGSLTDPVSEDDFDTIVSNPPFVVSPGWQPGGGGLEYRDSGFAGDDVVRTLLETLPHHLTPGGTAQLLANWIIPPDGAWDERLASWLTGRGVDAWIWQREALDPAAYITLWLRDAGEDPSGPGWAARFDHWLAWFRDNGILGVGMGVITLRRVARAPVVVCEDVRQDIDAPAGPWIAGWLDRVAWLAETDDPRLLATGLRRDPAVDLASVSTASGTGWLESELTLRQAAGLRFEIPTDRSIAALVAGCDGTRPLQALAAVLAAVLDQSTQDVAAALLPVVRDLIQRGILLPPDGRADGTVGGVADGGSDR